MPARQVDLSARAAPFIERINEGPGETVHLGVQGDAMMKVAKRESRQPCGSTPARSARRRAARDRPARRCSPGCRRTTCAACFRMAAPLHAEDHRE